MTYLESIIAVYAIGRFIIELMTLHKLDRSILIQEQMLSIKRLWVQPGKDQLDAYNKGYAIGFAHGKDKV